MNESIMTNHDDEKAMPEEGVAGTLVGALVVVTSFGAVVGLSVRISFLDESTISNVPCAWYVPSIVETDTCNGFWVNTLYSLVGSLSSRYPAAEIGAPRHNPG